MPEISEIKVEIGRDAYGRRLTATRDNRKRVWRLDAVSDDLTDRAAEATRQVVESAAGGIASYKSIVRAVAQVILTALASEGMIEAYRRAAWGPRISWRAMSAARLAEIMGEGNG